MGYITVQYYTALSYLVTDKSISILCMTNVNLCMEVMCYSQG